MKNVSVVVADDSSEILSAVSALLSRQYAVIGNGLNGAQAFEIALRLRPDVIVLDIQMPEIDGIQTARSLQRVGSQARIVFLTSLQHAEIAAYALNLESHSYVLKSRLHLDLPIAITAALEGRVFHSSRLADAPDSPALLS